MVRDTINHFCRVCVYAIVRLYFSPKSWEERSSNQSTNSCKR